jgi:hypothetical protein
MTPNLQPVVTAYTVLCLIRSILRFFARYAPAPACEEFTTARTTYRRTEENDYDHP